MYSVTRLLDVNDADQERMLTALRVAADDAALRSVIAPTLAGSRNGGDVLMHLRFTDRSDWQCAATVFAELLSDPAVTRVTGADYSGTPLRCATTPGAVYRTLLLRVAPDTAANTIAQFEAELALMPRYISTIRAWQLSRTDATVGATDWTHVFEQEFTDVDGLMGPYLMHPIHWAAVDRWFDPETTDVIIRDRVCHSFCTMQRPVLS